MIESPPHPNETVPCPTCGEMLQVGMFGPALCPNCALPNGASGFGAIGSNYVTRNDKPIIEADAFNKPQCRAVESEADELFYGGGAGGGKTWVLLTLAITKHRR